MSKGFRNGNLLPGKWRQFWVLVVNDNSLKARLCIAINDIWWSSFLHNGVLTYGRGHYVILRIGLRKSGLLNINALSHARNRMVLWKSILSPLPIGRLRVTLIC